jgi:hypothetical protein
MRWCSTPGWAPEQGRFRRLENLGVVSGNLQRALTGGVLALEPVRSRLVQHRSFLKIEARPQEEVAQFRPDR